MSWDLKMNGFAKSINGKRTLQAAYKGWRWMKIKEKIPVENTSYDIWTCDWYWRVIRCETRQVSRRPIMVEQYFYAQKFATFIKVSWRFSFNLVKLISRVWLFATPWTVAHQAPPSMGFSRQEYWSGLPFPSSGDLPNPRIEPRSPTLQVDALTSEPPIC